MQKPLLFVIAAAAAFSPTVTLAQDAEAAPRRTTAEVVEGEPRYLDAMRSELTAMRLREVECEAVDAERGTCLFLARGATTSREFTVRMVYSDGTDTIYMYVDRFLRASADAPSTAAVLRRLMELNWSLLLGKFEWDSTDGEVRLAMILNTDSNFDRRAFRSAARGITQLADRYYGELDRLTRQPASE